MARGVKKIKWTGKGAVYQSRSDFSSRIVIPADKEVWFAVSEWHTGTKPEDKTKNISWLWQEHDRNIIIHKRQIPGNKSFSVKMPSKLCGSYSYYLEASLSGKTDPNFTGLYVNGLCSKKIIASKWCSSVDGPDRRQTPIFYGNDIHLNLDTEGLNGDKVIIEIYNIQKLRSDKLIFTYTNVKVADGEVNLEIRNTAVWQGKVSNIQEEEKFYIKVKDQVTGQYILDGKSDDEHGRFLRIKNKLVANTPKPPVNNTPLKTGEPSAKAERYEPCKFETISITETETKDGKVSQNKVKIFDNGTGLVNPVNQQNEISKTIFFNFDSDVITKDGSEKLQNTLSFLLEHEHSIITINGYACVIGKMEYNKTLSQKRSDAVKKFFADGKLDTRRIVSTGKGEIKATDNHSEGDNLKYKDEKEYIEARRVDISFKYFGHTAKTIEFETIAPSKDKDLLIDITGFQTNACFRDKDKHKKEVKITSTEYKTPLIKQGEHISFPIHSALSTWNVAPLQYIWPKWNLIEGATGKGVDSAEEYNVFIHSCRYFSENKNSTILIKAYPDIKWKFDFFLNLSNKLSVKWQKLSPERDKEMKSKAGKIGAEKRWKQTEIDFGVLLDANWNSISDDRYSSHFDATLKYEEKIKQFYKIFESIKEFSKGVTGQTKGKLASSRLGKALPFKIFINPPNFCLGAEWQLERGEKNKIKLPELGTKMEFYFKAEPLIELAINIDLLDGIVQVGVGVVTGGAGNIAAKQIFNEVRDWLADDDHAFVFKMYFDLEIKGTINGSSVFTINTNSDNAKGEAKLDTILKVELKAGIEVRGAIVIVIGEAYVEAEASAKGSASVTFGHGLYYEKKSNVPDVYYQPKLKFDGLKVTGVLKAKVGLSIKKGIFKSDHSKNLVDYKFDKTLFEPFDVIEKLEKVSGINSKISLIK